MKKTEADNKAELYGPPRLKTIDEILTVDFLMSDITTALKDYFIADVKHEKGYISLKFIIGKEYKLYVEEVKRLPEKKMKI